LDASICTWDGKGRWDSIGRSRIPYST
jgi:hypothetical protein